MTFVALPPPFDVWNAKQLWVSEPRLASESGASVHPLSGFPDFYAAKLECTTEPHYTDWTTFDFVHVFHEGIIPEADYTVEVIDETCDRDSQSSYSDPLEMTTASWGDTMEDFTTTPPGPPNGSADIIDVLAIVYRFQSAPGSIRKARADLEPGCLDLVINISDVLQGVNGFLGVPYPFTPTAPDPCGSTCGDPWS